jgi:hypothetical protein
MIIAGTAAGCAVAVPAAETVPVAVARGEWLAGRRRRPAVRAGSSLTLGLALLPGQFVVEGQEMMIRLPGTGWGKVVRTKGLGIRQLRVGALGPDGIIRGHA